MEDYFLRAGELNRGLPRRDSLLVAAESLFSALSVGEDLPVPLRQSLRRRQFATLEEGARLYPDDPEMWYILGEVRFHTGWEARVSQLQMLDAFDRSIALDSSFSPAYIHATTLGLTLYGLDGWNRYARPYLALRLPDEHLAATRFLDTIFKLDRTHPGRADSIIRSTSLGRLYSGMFDSWHFPDSAETAVRLARALIAAPGDSAGDRRLRASGRRQMLAAALAYRGHLREALELIEGERVEWIGSVPAAIAILGSSRPESVDATFGRWLRQGSFWPPVGGWPPGRLIYALPWWAARRDTLALAEYARRADSTLRVTSQPRWRERAQYAAQAARAYSGLARGDTTAALQFFLASPRDISNSLAYVTAAQILMRQGRDADALELLEEAFPTDWRGPLRTLARLEAARAAERLGQRKRAAAHYQFVVDVWRHADPELEPYLREARAGLERLVAEPSR
jgi:tetratricopeptide (TPR) repeat protein